MSRKPLIPPLPSRGNNISNTSSNRNETNNISSLKKSSSANHDDDANSTINKATEVEQATEISSQPVMEKKNSSRVPKLPLRNISSSTSSSSRSFPRRPINDKNNISSSDESKQDALQERARELIQKRRQEREQQSDSLSRTKTLPTSNTSSSSTSSNSNTIGTQSRVQALLQKRKLERMKNEEETDKKPKLPLKFKGGAQRVSTLTDENTTTATSEEEDTTMKQEEEEDETLAPIQDYNVLMNYNTKVISVSELKNDKSFHSLLNWSPSKKRSASKFIPNMSQVEEETREDATHTVGNTGTVNTVGTVGGATSTASILGNTQSSRGLMNHTHASTGTTTSASSSTGTVSTSSTQSSVLTQNTAGNSTSSSSSSASRVKDASTLGSLKKQSLPEHSNGSRSTSSRSSRKDKFIEQENVKMEAKKENLIERKIAPAQASIKETSTCIVSSTATQPEVQEQRKSSNKEINIHPAFSKLVSCENVITVNNIPYVNLGVVGKGASCKVYRTLSQDRRILAIKKVKLAGMAKKSIEGYANEIALLRKLRGNPAIIQLYDSEVDIKRKAIFLVMEPGEIDLNQVLQQQRSQNSGEGGSHVNMNFIRLTWQQMLNAVHCIHEARIIHGDLKPANFLFIKGVLKLIDFGIAKAIQNDDTTNIHRESQVGTVNYMSPESILDSGKGKNGALFKCGRPSDVWSLGCILYQMCYSKTPFADLQLFPKLQAIVDPNYEIEFPETVDSVAIDAIKQCLHRKPEDRAPIVGQNGLLNAHKFLN